VEVPGRETAYTKENFLSLLVPVKKHLYNFIRKSLNYSAEADDVFQETILKGFRYFYSYNTGKSFKTWIFTIAHNLMEDSYTYGEKNLSVSLDEVGEIVGECGTVRHEVREIYAAAHGLPSRNREIFFLYYYNEFEVSEIAKVTGLSGPNIKFILHQARKYIKKQMEVRQ
jgi:RNA polymerase sigma-70 factor (ECF subfamily)